MMADQIFLVAITPVFSVTQSFRNKLHFSDSLLNKYYLLVSMLKTRCAA